MKKWLLLSIVFIIGCKDIQLDVSEANDKFGGKNPVGLLEIAFDKKFGTVRIDKTYCSVFATEDGDLLTNDSCLSNLDGMKAKTKNMRVYFKVPNEPDTHEYKIVAIDKRYSTLGSNMAVLIPEDKAYIAQTFGTFKKEKTIPKVELLENNLAVTLVTFDEPGDNKIAKLRVRNAYIATAQTTELIKMKTQ